LLGVEPMSYPSLEETGFAVCGRMLLLRQPKGPTHTLTLFDPVEGKNLWTRDCGAGAHAAALGSAAVGVMERDGHFVLLAMLDGRPIVDAQLEPERSLADIFLFSSAGQYFLLTNSMSGHPANGLPAPQAMPGCSAKPIDKGRLYAFDRQGALLWPKPTGEKDTMWSNRVAIADQYFLLNQHERLPVLVFAVQKYDQALNAQGKYEIKLLCIDKRTGRTVFKDKFIGPTGVFNVSGDPEKRTVTINMARNTIALTFTDQPIPPPEPPAKKQTGDRKGENTTVPKALWKSLQRAIGGGADEASTDEEEEPPANP
jgi:hypothetical protein